MGIFTKLIDALRTKKGAETKREADEHELGGQPGGGQPGGGNQPGGGGQPGGSNQPGGSLPATSDPGGQHGQCCDECKRTCRRNFWTEVLKTVTKVAGVVLAAFGLQSFGEDS